MMGLSKRERVFRALDGEPVDRAPVSAWGHYYNSENSAERLAQVMLDHHRRYGWDFVKVQARASYHSEPWGAHFEASPDGVQRPACPNPPLSRPEDWAALERLEPTTGALGEQLKALRLIKRGLGDGAPILHTVFSPLTIARDLIGFRTDTLVEHLRAAPDLVEAGLEAIASTFEAYAPLCLEAGADGLFYAATVGPSAGLMTAEEYRRWGRPHDLRILRAAGEASFNMLHLCGPRVLFEAFLDYPVQALNWACSLVGNPSLHEARRMTDKALAGGIAEHGAIEQAGPAEVRDEALRALEETGGMGFLLTPECSLRLKLILEGSLAALRTAAESYSA